MIALDRMLQGRNLSKFDHVKNDRQVVSAEELAAQQAIPVYSLKHMSEDTKRVMAKLNSADSATVSLQERSLHVCELLAMHEQPAEQQCNNSFQRQAGSKQDLCASCNQGRGLSWHLPESSGRRQGVCYCNHAMLV